MTQSDHDHEIAIKGGSFALSDLGHAFDETFNAMVEEANGYHEFYDKSFLRWKLPEQPPQDLDLSAT